MASFGGETHHGKRRTASPSDTCTCFSPSLTKVFPGRDLFPSFLLFSDRALSLLTVHVARPQYSFSGDFIRTSSFGVGFPSRRSRVEAVKADSPRPSLSSAGSTYGSLGAIVRSRTPASRTIVGTCLLRRPSGNGLYFFGSMLTRWCRMFPCPFAFFLEIGLCSVTSPRCFFFFVCSAACAEDPRSMREGLQAFPFPDQDSLSFTRCGPAMVPLLTIRVFFFFVDHFFQIRYCSFLRTIKLAGLCELLFVDRSA